MNEIKLTHYEDGDWQGTDYELDGKGLVRDVTYCGDERQLIAFTPSLMIISKIRFEGRTSDKVVSAARESLLATL